MRYANALRLSHHAAMKTLPTLLTMAHPGDVSELDVRIKNGTIRADQIVAVIGKTEGNGGVNDFTRGYFTQSLMHLLSVHLDASPAELAARIPCILSGGTEGVLSPHYVVFCRSEEDTPSEGGALAIGHPLGASGARLATTALNQLERIGGRYALCTMCIGVGQGIALIIERV